MIFAPITINVQIFKLNSLDNASVSNLGASQHYDLFVSYKRNQGVGEQNGDFSPILLPVSSVIDPDLSDSPTIKNSVI